MNVGELIAELEKWPKDREIIVDHDWAMGKPEVAEYGGKLLIS